MKNNHIKYSSVVAIDGPSGSGKSTIAKLVAGKMNYTYIDTGAMFRSLAYILKSRGFEINEPTIAQVDQIKKELSKLNFQYGVSDSELVVIDKVNLTEKIREHEVSKLASQVSQIQVVRDYLKDCQRKIAGENHCVMEGRDIGTVIFPNAFCKIFLTASNEVRAKRRFEQLRQKGDSQTSYEKVLEDIKARDKKDTTRASAPLKKAYDAVEVDTSDLTIDQVVQRIVEISHSKENLL